MGGNGRSESSRSSVSHCFTRTLANESSASHVLVNLASLPVLSEEPPEDPHAAQPHDLGRHPRLGRTLPLSGTGVPSLPLGGLHVPNSGTRVDDGGLDDDVSILEELADSGSGVGVANLGSLLGVEPDLSLTDTGDVGGQSVTIK